MEDRYKQAWSDALAMLDNMITTYPHEWQTHLIQTILNRLKDIMAKHGLNTEETGGVGVVYGDDSLLETIADQSKTIITQQERIRRLAEELALLRAGENAEKCVLCGAIIPEGTQVCPRCASLYKKEAPEAWPP